MAKKAVFLILIFLIAIGFSNAREYSISHVGLEYFLNENGDINVKEQITYDLSGEFSELYKSIPNGVNFFNETGYCIGKECSFYTSKTSSGTELILKSNYKNEKITVVFNYIIKDQILLQKDCSQFFYKLWGDEWERGVKRIDATIYLPEEMNGTWLVYYIHPFSENMNSKLIGNKIIINLINHPEKTYLEINLLMPKDAFIGLKNAKNYMGKNEIISIEQNEIKNNENLDKFKEVFFYFLIFIAIAIPLFILYLYLKHGKDEKIEKLGFFGPFEHEPPSKISPSVASYLIEFRVAPDSVVGEVLYLVNKKILNMKEMDIEKDYLFFKKTHKGFAFWINENSDLEKLDSHQKKILELIRENLVEKNGGKYFFFEELKPNSVRIWYKSFADSVKGQFKSLKYLEDNITKKVIYTVSAFFIFIIVGFIFLPEKVMQKVVFLFIIIFIELFFILFICSLRPDILGKWSVEGRIANHRWNNFKKYLKNETLMKEKNPQDIILWEQYLAYGTAFGVSKKVLSALKMVSLKTSKSSMLNNPVLIGSAITSISSSMASASGASKGGGGSGGGGGGGGGGAR